MAVGEVGAGCVDKRVTGIILAIFQKVGLKSWTRRSDQSGRDLHNKTTQFYKHCDSITFNIYKQTGQFKLLNFRKRFLS